MDSDENGRSFVLRIDLGLGEAADVRELDALTRAVREQLLELDVASVRAAESETASASKGLGLTDAGKLFVEFVGEGPLGPVVAFIRQWIARDAGRTARLTIGEDSIELKGLSPAQQQQLLDAWVARVAGRGP